MINRKTLHVLTISIVLVLALFMDSADASASMSTSHNETDSSMSENISSGECSSGTGAGNSAVQSDDEQGSTRSLQPAQPEPVSAPAADPVRLQIPALDVDTDIEPVGVAENGNMAEPTEWNDAGWFEPGPRPGGIGNAVIAGHYDSPWGPAVFYRIDSLVPEDEIIVTMDDDSELRFAVTKTLVVSAEDAPLQEIFGISSDRNLNLITCYGVYDRERGLYDDRLVVFTELIED
jgi:sortase A